MKYIVNLNVWSNYSFLASTISFDSYIKFAKTHNLKALALTDKNVMYGAYEFYQKCRENAIKPIIGLDCQWHDEAIINLTIIAVNNKGYETLMILASFLNTTQQYLTLKEVQTNLVNNDNLFVIIKAEHHEITKLSKYYQILNINNNDFVYIGVNYRNIKQLAKYENITKLLVAIDTVKYLTKTDASLLQLLQAIKDQKVLANEQLLQAGSAFYWSLADLKLVFPEQLLINITTIVNKCLLIFPELTNKVKITNLPNFSCPTGWKQFSYLQHLCDKGLNNYIDKTNQKLWDKYQKRLDYELAIIKTMKFSDYFLIVQDYVQFAKSRGILVGPGRGSAASSLVAYILGITTVDPLQYDLLFERFLNEERQTLPDIDIDLEDERREEIFHYLVSKYGRNHVARIVTFQTIASKMALRDLARVFVINLDEVNEMTKLIANQYNFNLDLALINAPKLAVYEQKYPLLFQFAKRIIGFPRQTGTHAAGVVLTKANLTKYTPIQNSYDEIYQTQYAMNNLATIGLIKMDILGLRNLTTLKNILANIKKHYDQTLVLSAIPLHDKKTFAIISNGDTSGIFQLESPGMREVVKAMQVSSFEDIIAASSLFRPGPQDYIKTYIMRKFQKRPNDYYHHHLTTILAPTYGIIVYQEQIMLILQKVANFSLAKADIIRRAISKKNSAEMLLEKQNFFNNGSKNGYDMANLTKIWSDIVQFAKYGFNRAHAVAYSLISYWLAYLKTNFPLAFMSCLLTSAINNDSKLPQYLQECQKYNIKVLPPAINDTEIAFKLKQSENALIYSLQAVKQMSYNSCRLLLANRNEQGRFLNFWDFCARMVAINLVRKSIEYLIAAGALDEFNYNRITLLANLDNGLKYGNIVQVKTKSSQNYNFKFPTPAIINYPDNWETNATNEYLALGCYLKFNLEQKWKQSLDPENKTISLWDIEKYVQKSILIWGQIVFIKIIKTKTNHPMAFIMLKSDNKMVDITIFSAYYTKYQMYLQHKKVLLLLVKVSTYQTKISLILEKIVKIYQ